MRDVARDYLCPTVATFWQWRDAGRVVAWPDGTTITFHGELLTVLQRLVPQGLPPLGAVLLLLAATRESWETAAAEQVLLSSAPSTEELTLMRNVLSRLEQVSRLEPDLRASAVARAVLAEMVFEYSGERLTPQESAGVIERLCKNDGDELFELASSLQQSTDEDAPPAIGQAATLQRFRDLRGLHRGLSHFDPAALKLRLSTGLDSLPAAAPLDMPAADQVRRFLKTLDNDPEFSGLARLARDLTAAVTLPRAITDTEEMPLGGVSDISNRGPLDRLLLSELAHDDMVLAVRVAANEALYLRRETPPLAPVPGRAVLLDAGIRSWGVPRVFATSVALALAATTDRRAACTIYRAQGRTAEPVDLTQREGLVQHLSVLEPDLHPGAALSLFQQLLTAADVAEKVVVTTDDVLDDTEFQAALATSELRPLYLISVNRSGRLRLLGSSLRGTKLIREAQLDLNELLAGRRQGTLPLIGEPAARELPLIFFADPFPLRLSHPISETLPVWVLADKRVLTITGDRRLMLWSSKQHGGQQISTSVPSGSVLWTSHDRENRVAHAIIGPRGGASFHLLRIDLDQFHCECKPISLPQNSLILGGHNGAVFARQRVRGAFVAAIRVLSESTGEMIGSLPLPVGVDWRSERFFSHRDRSQYFALSFDGHSAGLQTVLSEEQRQRLPQLELLTEHPEIEGPIGVTRNGVIVYTATGETRDVGQGVSLPLEAKTSPAARGWVLLNWVGTEVGAVELKRLLSNDVVHRNRFHEILTRDVVRVVNQRYRFSRIYVDADGVLTLVSSQGKRFGIMLDKAPMKICLRPHTGSPASELHWQDFQPFSLPNHSSIDIGFPMFVVRWPDGSRVFLDGRGLLHLKSSDLAIPEATIVLGDGALSGWCSDGRFWGKSYFIGDHPASADHEIFQSVIHPFVERLRCFK